MCLIGFVLTVIFVKDKPSDAVEATPTTPSVLCSKAS